MGLIRLRMPARTSAISSIATGLQAGQDWQDMFHWPGWKLLTTPTPSHWSWKTMMRAQATSTDKMVGVSFAWNWYTVERPNCTRMPETNMGSWFMPHLAAKRMVAQVKLVWKSAGRFSTNKARSPWLVSSCPDLRKGMASWKLASTTRQARGPIEANGTWLTGSSWPSICNLVGSSSAGLEGTTFFATGAFFGLLAGLFALCWACSSGKTMHLQGWCLHVGQCFQWLPWRDPQNRSK